MTNKLLSENVIKKNFSIYDVVLCSFVLSKITSIWYIQQQQTQLYELVKKISL